MIEENKVWKVFSGYKEIDANSDSCVVLLCEMADGLRCLDHALYFNGKWKAAFNASEKRVIGYYEVLKNGFTRCRNKVSDPIETIPVDFRGEALVLWEWEKDKTEGIKLSSVFESRVFYATGWPGITGPKYVVGYHILPDMILGKFEDGSIRTEILDVLKMERMN